MGFGEKELPLSWTTFTLSTYIKPCDTLVNSDKHIKPRSYLPFVSKEHWIFFFLLIHFQYKHYMKIKKTYYMKRYSFSPCSCKDFIFINLRYALCVLTSQFIVNMINHFVFDVVQENGL